MAFFTFHEQKEQELIIFVLVQHNNHRILNFIGDIVDFAGFVDIIAVSVFIVVTVFLLLFRLLLPPILCRCCFCCLG